MSDLVLNGSAFETVAEAYNCNAEKYDEFIENNPNLQRMRHKVYAHVTSLLPHGSRILDLACGTGTDAFWFAQHGYTVHGVDISEGMLDRAKEKARRFGLESRATFEHLFYTELRRLEKNQFDCTFSNFGGLNCVSDLKQSLLTKSDRSSRQMQKSSGHSCRRSVCGNPLTVDGGYLMR